MTPSNAGEFGIDIGIYRPWVAPLLVAPLRAYETIGRAKL
jgi:hypothetical protein